MEKERLVKVLREYGFEVLKGEFTDGGKPYDWLATKKVSDSKITFVIYNNKMRFQIYVKKEKAGWLNVSVEENIDKIGIEKDEANNVLNFIKKSPDGSIKILFQFSFPKV